MDLRQWLVDEFDETVTRLETQVLCLVPEDRRREQPGGGNSILWACFHAARHADLALSVLTGEPPITGEGGGLEEDEQPWAKSLDPQTTDRYLGDVLAAGRRFLGAVDPEALARHPDTTAALHAAGVPDDTFEWLYRMWRGKPAAFLVRWPLIGHLGNHVGEMIATRNRMGLSPF